MKAIIDGLRYDTDSPRTEKVACYDNNVPINDFQWWSACLYRTGGGRFFLHGEGGPMTRFSRRSGNTSTYGERIVPLSKNDARVWCEQYSDPETVERWFDVADA